MDRNQELINKLTGRTILSVNIIKAEYGRMYDNYICIVFTDKTKIILHGGVPYDPDPSEEQMKIAGGFFTPEEIAAKALKEQQKIQRWKNEEFDKEKRMYEQLKKKFEGDVVKNEPNES